MFLSVDSWMVLMVCMTRGAIDVCSTLLTVDVWPMEHTTGFAYALDIRAAGESSNCRTANTIHP